MTRSFEVAANTADAFIPVPCFRACPSNRYTGVLAQCRYTSPGRGGIVAYRKATATAGMRY